MDWLSILYHTIWGTLLFVSGYISGQRNAK
jgi:hypothetical protein